MAIPQEIQEQVLEEAYSVTPDYSVDYNGQQFTDLNNAHQQRVDNVTQSYDDVIGSVDHYYDDARQELDKWEQTQSQIQNDQTDFLVSKIEQQKEQAEKDYKKEQSGAYVDWRKKSNQYGAEAEKMASAGLTNTGYSESSQVSMYNTYQNRVAKAKESLNLIMLEYNNSIKEAQLQNNAALAEIASQTAMRKIELLIEGNQYKSQLMLDKSNKLLELENMKWNQQQDILRQINTENAMKEEIRQYQETMKWQTEQAQLDRNFEQLMKKADRQHDKKMAKLNYDYAVELEGVKTAEEKERLENEWEIKKKQMEQELADAKALAKYQYDLQRTQITSGGSSRGVKSLLSGVVNAVKTVTDKAQANITSKKPTTSSNTTSKNPFNYKIDMKSAGQAMGGSVYNATKLWTMVKSGEVLMTVKNGTAYFEKNPLYFKNKYSFGK